MSGVGSHTIYMISKTIKKVSWKPLSPWVKTAGKFGGYPRLSINHHLHCIPNPQRRSKLKIRDSFEQIALSTMHIKHVELDIVGEVYIQNIWKLFIITYYWIRFACKVPL